MPDQKDFEIMGGKLDLLNERVASLKSSENGKTHPWYAVATGVLGIPAIVIVMVMNFSQYRTNAATIEKTMHETKKTELEIERLRSKTSEFQEVTESEDIGSLRSALGEAISLLRASAEQIEKQRIATPTVTTIIILRFVVAWAFLHFIGVVFSTFYLGWDLIIPIPYTIGNWLRQRMRNRERLAEEKLRKSHQGKEHDYELEQKQRDELYASFERRRSRLDLLMEWTSIGLRTLPRLFEVSLQIAVFVVVIIPIFDLVASHVGSDVRFEQVLASAKNLDFGKCLAYVRDLVSPAVD